MSDQPHYPYADGDIVVLGPQVFASADGETISWQGANYRRDHGPAGADAERLDDLDAEPEPARWCCNGNAETCPLCSTADLPYPWICPGHRDTPANRARIRDRAAASGGTDLRQQIAAALRASWDTAFNVHRDDAIRRDTDAVLDVIQPHLDRLRKAERAVNLLADVRRRAEQAEAALARVRDVIAERRTEVAERETDGMLPFGTPGASWCDAVTVTCDRVEEAMRTPTEAVGIPVPPAHDGGPTVREAAANDRRWWGGEKTGEQ